MTRFILAVVVLVMFGTTSRACDDESKWRELRKLAAATIGFEQFEEHLASTRVFLRKKYVGRKKIAVLTDFRYSKDAEAGTTVSGFDVEKERKVLCDVAILAKPCEFYYGFSFNYDADGLITDVGLWYGTRNPRPSLSGSSDTEKRPNKSPEPTPTAVTPRANE